MAMEANASSTMDFQEHCMLTGRMHQEATTLSARRGVRDRKRQGGTHLGFLFPFLFWFTLTYISRRNKRKILSLKKLKYTLN